MTPEEQEPQVISEDALVHCGRRMRVYNTHVERVDGIPYRMRYWRCLRCGKTGKTAAPEWVYRGSIHSQFKRH